MKPDVEAAARSFAVAGEPVGVEPLVGGHINATYVLRYRDDRGLRRFVLQRINEVVFVNPLEVIDNVRRVTDHVAAALRAQGVQDVSRRVLML
ncbi:MAG: mucin desulfatase, partial [Planctomycetota bacterium]